MKKTKKPTSKDYEKIISIQERIINMLDVDPRKLIKANQSTISTILEELLVEDSKDYEDSEDSIESLSSEEEEEALFLINRIKELRKKNKERKRKHTHAHKTHKTHTK